MILDIFPYLKLPSSGDLLKETPLLHRVTTEQQGEVHLSREKTEVHLTQPQGWGC